MKIEYIVDNIGVIRSVGEEGPIAIRGVYPVITEITRNDGGNPCDFRLTYSDGSSGVVYHKWVVEVKYSA